MKIKIFLLLCFLFLINASSSIAQKGDWGIGLRVGDPTGLSIKRYKGKKAIEFNFGRAYYIGRHNYEDDFYRIGKYKDKNYYQYYNSTFSTPLAFQLHILAQKGLSDIKGLDVYYGLGPQFRYERIKYGYRYGRGGAVYYEDFNDYDLGLDGVLGLEYTLDDIPMSIFMDVNLFMEIVNDPFLPLFQGGIGFRYNLSGKK